MKDSWPQVDPLTGRKVCQMCWNQLHKLCWNTRAECNCACIDRPVRLAKTVKRETLDIAEVYETIEIT
jgi:hypothetical protein